MIHLTCPHCSEPVSFGDHLAGFTVKCPACQVPLDISPSSETAPDSPIQEGQSVPPFPFLTHEPAFHSVAEPVVPNMDQLRRPPSLWKWWAILLAIPLLLAGLAWLMEGNDWWRGIGYVMLVLVGFSTFYFVKELYTELGTSRITAGELLILPYAWAVVGVWWGVGWLAMSGTVYVDNFSAQPVLLELDGRPWIEVDRVSTERRTVRHGAHHLTVRPKGGGESLQELDVMVEGQGVYIFNVLKAQTYSRGQVRYGGFSFLPSDDTETVINDAWIDVTKVHYLFETPPESIKVSVPKGMPAGLTFETRSWLQRGNPAGRKDRKREQDR